MKTRSNRGTHSLDGLLRIVLVSIVVVSFHVPALAGEFLEAPQYATGIAPVSVAIGDFNRDGKPDLVAANQSGFTVSVLLGNGDGTFQSRVD